MDPETSVVSPDPAVTGTTPDPAAPGTPEPTYTKAALTDLIKREVGKVTAKYEARIAELTGENENLKGAAESGLTASQKADKERAKAEATLKSLNDLAAQRLQKLHDLTLDYEVEKRLASLPLADGVNREVLSSFARSKMAVDENLKVALVGPDGAREDLDDAKWDGFVKAHFGGFLKQATGSGAPHGAPKGRLPTPTEHMSSNEKILAGLEARQKR